QPNQTEQQFLYYLQGEQLVDETLPAHTFFEGAGCATCNHTGHKGRIGVYEWLEITHAMADALREQHIEKFNQLVAKAPNYTTLAQSALTLASKGTIALSEVLRLSEWVE